MIDAPEYQPFQFRIADLSGNNGDCCRPGSHKQAARVAVFTRFPYSPFSTWRNSGILRLRVRPWLALLLYLVVLLALLPYLYCRLNDCPPPTAFDLGCWIDLPILAFTVPTAFFLYDILVRLPALKVYVIRSLLEITILIPVWFFLWTLLKFLYLSWIRLPH